jgi:hypothetical protein
MKIKFFGVIAILIALSASAFTSAKAKPSGTSLVWFTISGSIAPGANVPKADAAYMNTGTAPNSNEGCPSSATYQCVSGFTSSQVSGTQLKDNNQSPASTPYEHN